MRMAHSLDMLCNSALNSQHLPGEGPVQIPVEATKRKLVVLLERCVAGLQFFRCSVTRKAEVTFVEAGDE